MAKKKSESDDSLETSIVNILNKKYGQVCRPASEILTQDLKVFSTGSASLDLATGGIQEGSLIELAGIPKVGKTTLLMQTLVGYQQENRDCFFIDGESRFGQKNLQIHGLDPNKLTVIRSEQDKILDANDTLNLIENIMRSCPGAAIVLDSVSSLCSRERAADEVDAQRRDTRPKLWSDFIAGVSALIRINRISFFTVRHMGVNQGQGKKYLADGGMKLDYRKDVSLHCTWSEKWEEAGKYIGKILHIEVLASNFKAPVERVDTYLRFGYGIDIEREVLMQSLDFGLSSRSGSWITLDFMDEPKKVQGESNAAELLKANPEVFKQLQNKIKELLV